MRSIFLLLSLLSKTTAFQCDTSSNVTCILNGINTNETNTFVNLTPDDEVTTIQFEETRIHTFTKDICEAFPKLENLFARQLSLKIVASDALNSCMNLKSISFNHNLLETLDARLFEKTVKLNFVSFAFNRLRKIEGKLFEPLVNLHTLSLNSNYLRELPLDDFPKLQDLDRLNIDFNNIRRLDEWLLVSKFPNLKAIDFRRNLFDCDRLKAIINLMDSKQIGYSSGTAIRNGGHLNWKIKGIQCRNVSESDTTVDVEEMIAGNSVKSLNGTIVDLGDQMFAYNMAFVAFVVLDLAFFVFFFVLGIQFVRKHQIQRV